MQRNSSSHSSTAPSTCNKGSSGNFRSHIAPSACLAGSHLRRSYSGSGDPTRGKECSTSQPPGGAPPLDDAYTSASRAQGTPLSGGHKCSASEIPTGISNSTPSPLVHFPNYTFSKSCQLKETDLGEAIPMWHFCLIGYVAGKFPSYASLLHFIGKHWQHKAKFTMHDSGWLIFAFHSELEMLETLSSGPYFVFGRPFILKIMPEFFDFQASDMTKLPTWVKLPNLPCDAGLLYASQSLLV